MNEYYADVASYFDEAAAEYEARYWANPILQRIRQTFREEVKRYPFRVALEVGCGPGIDLAHFGTIFPERSFLGVDVSPRMVELARQRIVSMALRNVRVETGSAEGASELLGPEAFDLGYVFFGALNTVESLDRVADRLYAALAPGGHLVLSFVNRWYVAEIALGLLRGRFRQAFSRLGGTWAGYGDDRRLASRCVSPREVHRAFGPAGDLIHRRGLSLTYPAWYRARMLRSLGRLGPRLWEMDRWLSRTPAWSLGEYTLYVYRKRAAADVEERRR
jgi:SAM-dependent methyltransferase